MRRKRFDRLKTGFLGSRLTDEEHLELRQLVQTQDSLKRDLIAELHVYERLDQKLRYMIDGLKALLQRK